MCERIEVCFEEGDLAGCIADCTVDLSDCSSGGLEAAGNCETRPCPGVESCLMSVPCVASE